MGDRYAATGDQTVAATPGATVLGIEGVATARGRIYEWDFGSVAAPSDVADQWLIRRSTTLGTSTPVTPTLLDSDAPAALLGAGSNHTVEPTYAAGSELFDMGLNRRASWRWVAVPESEMLVPATATAAIGLTPIGAAAGGDVAATAHWVE